MYKRDFYPGSFLPKINEVAYRFLIWCSGSDLKMLELCPETERKRHSQYGYLVLIPAVIGFMAMTYAISTLTTDCFYYWSIGIVWGMIVFALDRFIISTLNRNLLTRFNYISALFIRIFYAVFIGLVVGHPVILLALEKDINIRIEESKGSNFKKNTKDIPIVEHKYDSIRHKSDSLFKIELKIVKNKINDYQQLVNYELAGLRIKNANGESSGIPGKSTYTENFQRNLDSAKDEKSLLINKFSADTAALKVLQQSEIDTIKSRARFLDSLFIASKSYLTKTTALEEIKSEDNYGGKSARTMYWVLIILFIVIDTVVVIFKSITHEGMYEKLVAYETMFGTIPASFYNVKRKVQEEIYKINLDYDVEKKKNETIRDFLNIEYEKCKDSPTFHKDITRLEQIRNLYKSKNPTHSDITYDQMILRLINKLGTLNNNHSINSRSASLFIAFIFLLIGQVIFTYFTEEGLNSFLLIGFLIVDFILTRIENKVIHYYNIIHNKVFDTENHTIQN